MACVLLVNCRWTGVELHRLTGSLVKHVSGLLADGVGTGRLHHRHGHCWRGALNVDFLFFFIPHHNPELTFAFSFSGAWTGEELPVLAQTGLATQHRDVRSFQDHNAVPHGVGLLRHHRTQDQTPPDGPGEDDLAPAVHGLAGSRLPRRYQRLSQWAATL